jgi:phosphoenolpyruvate carboxykinase (ATP)
MPTIDWAKTLGLNSVGKVYHNISYEELFKHETENNEGTHTSLGAVNVDTGKFTGRSPKDKFFVDQAPSNEHIAWGDINKKTSAETFNVLNKEVREYLSGKDVYIFDGFVGANEASRRKVRVISEIAWQNHFVKNMFIRPTQEELANFGEPDFTVINACQYTDKNWKEHGLNSEVFVIFNVEERTQIIGGTWYGGEMKKGLFGMMNYWLPLEGTLSMHCSANIGKNGDTALFFGLSGTGKTTLSTDRHRNLIGDDEHGWDADGVFNIEGGCYAKVINLDPHSEPEIYRAIKRNALLENVVIEGHNHHCNFEDVSKTENTRVSYPIEHIEHFEHGLKGGHPKNIIFLSYDAFGILPPVAKLTKEQAMYYFLSGYTAKVAGTERGITEPTTAFSACFGEAFLPLHPTEYAKLLGEKIDTHGANVYLVNTGMTGGKYGHGGTRMSIKSTRACIDSILDGSIEDAYFTKMRYFGLEMPDKLNGVDSSILNPRITWDDLRAYDEEAKNLAGLFRENFKRYSDRGSEFDFSSAGPTLEA